MDMFPCFAAEFGDKLHPDQRKMLDDIIAANAMEVLLARDGKPAKKINRRVVRTEAITALLEEQELAEFADL